MRSPSANFDHLDWYGFSCLVDKKLHSAPTGKSLTGGNECQLENSLFSKRFDVIVYKTSPALH